MLKKALKILILVISISLCKPQFSFADEPEIESNLLEQATGKIYHRTEQRKKNKAPIPNIWKPILEKNSRFEVITPFVANLNVGIGFLYFAGNYGSFDVYQRGANPRLLDNVRSEARLKYRWNYNRTPLLESSLIWNLGATWNSLCWLGIGLSYLHQSDVYITYQTTSEINAYYGTIYAQFLNAFLELNAIALKLFFYAPYSLICKQTAFTPYIGLSCGPSWQTWSNIRINLNPVIRQNLNISSNCFFGSECGIKIHAIKRFLSLTAICGIKFNLWGQARNIGKNSKQPVNSFYGPGLTGLFLTHPFRIKAIYQWSPFIGLVITY